MNPLFVSAYRVSRSVKLHHNTTKKYLTALKLPTTRIGKRVYYRTADINEVIDSGVLSTGEGR